MERDDSFSRRGAQEAGRGKGRRSLWRRVLLPEVRSWGQWWAGLVLVVILLLAAVLGSWALKNSMTWNSHANRLNALGREVVLTRGSALLSGSERELCAVLDVLGWHDPEWCSFTVDQRVRDAGGRPPGLRIWEREGDTERGAVVTVVFEYDGESGKYAVREIDVRWRGEDRAGDVAEARAYPRAGVQWSGER